MEKLDLTSFGFKDKIFQYEGQIVSERQDGQRLLFLFDEAHDNKGMIDLNLRNACTLSDLDVLGCVGVEEYPYHFTGWNETHIRAKFPQCFTTDRTDEAVIRDRKDGDLNQFRFGKTLKLLRPALPIRSVEDFQLYLSVKAILAHFCALKTQVEDAAPDAIKGSCGGIVQAEFDACQLNVVRDDAFLRNLLPWWQGVAPGKAAILNAGASHQGRIVDKLSPDIAYIRINTAMPATQVS